MWRASHSSRPAGRCKNTPKNPPADAGPPRRPIPPTPPERARRGAAPRTARAGTAPLFQARLRAARGGPAMTATTTQHASPTATPRTARRGAALPNDPGLDDILADPNLTSTAKALITVMVRNWAWVKDHCWPSDEILAARLGMSVGHVQRCLRELERAGRIFRERTAAVPNGRRIWLLCACPGGRAGAPANESSSCSAPGPRDNEHPKVLTAEGGLATGVGPGRRPAGWLRRLGGTSSLSTGPGPLWWSRHPRRTPLVDKAPGQPPRLLCQTCPTFVPTA